MAPNFLKSSLENASFSILYQIMSRFLTFFLNVFVIRYTGEATLGVMNVRLLLLESFILFLSKEPFVKACLTNTSEHNWAHVVNLLWMTIPICSVMSCLFGFIWLNFLSTSEDLPDYYVFAVWAVAISCIIELTSLVVQLIASAFLFVKLGVVLDTLMIVLRTSTFIVFILLNPKNALLGFGVAQLLASIFYTISYYVYFYYYMKKLKLRKLRRRVSSSDDETETYVVSEFPFRTISDFLPGQLPTDEGRIFDKDLSVLTWSFFKQGFMKQILTEGERIVMTFLSVMKFAEQGTYEVINNLGSLAARFIFRPIEDSSYFYFSQMIKRDEPISKQIPEKIKESVTVLNHLCSLITSIGLIILVFGYSYSSLLLWLYGGAKLILPLPVLLMRAHCLAVLLLGINGITECYTNATADSATIDKNNRNMIFGSVIFLATSYMFVKLFGPTGFILGNCVNMALRIVHSVKYINERFAGTKYDPLRGLFPKPLFSCSLILSAVITGLSHMYYFPEHKIFHLFIGILMFCVVSTSWSYENYDLVKVGIIKLQEWMNNRKKIK